MIDDADTLPSDSALSADLCIVGAGAAGLTLALQLAGTGQRVLLLEAGGEKLEPAAQALYAGEVVAPDLHSPPDRYRNRMFGGTTSIWGGRCIPFDPIDLEQRPWVPHSGWPIGHGELARYYGDANALCEAGDNAYSAASALPGAMRPMIPGFEPQDFTTDPIERFSCPTDFAARYGHRLRASSNVRVLLHANVTEILMDDRGATVSKLVVQTLSGKRFEVTATRFVLATGGIETPRLMLASRRQNPRGIGNDHDLVGRFYMCHLAGQIGEIRFTGANPSVWHGYDRAWDGVYCRRRIALLPEAQREHGLGNVVMRLHHPRLPDPSHRTGILSAIYLAKPFISYEYSHRLHGAEPASAGLYLRHALNVARDPVAIVRFLFDWARFRTLASRKFPSVIIASKAHHYSLDIHAEQQPNPESRIRLGDASDAFGMPRVVVDWRWSAADIRTVSEAVRLFQAEVAAWGGATYRYDPDEVQSCMLRDGAYGGHHIGTARMADSPAQGVVDADCRVHGISNLYVAGSAVFPTSGQANPTLTIVALALRLADHLRSAPARRPPVAAAVPIGA